MKATGITSTSFKVWLTTFVPAVAAAAQALLTNGSAIHTAVFGGGGALVALVSTLGKLFHDNGLNKASLAAAGADISKALPDLKADLSTAVSFVENDFPSVKTGLADAQAKIAALEAKVPDLAGIETTVRNVLADVLKGAVAPPA